MPSILTIIGARPQFIKHAPVYRQLKQYFQVATLHTGQHYDPAMSGIFFDELHLPEPDFRLDLREAHGPGGQVGMMMTGIEDACNALKPDAMLLYGDTNSTLAGALVAARRGLPTIHVEAGIRSFNRAMPEEVNRIIADTFAALLFCPVPEAVDNLRREGIEHDGVQLSGDVMCDILELVRPGIRRMERGPYYFATVHRPYNTDDHGRMLRLMDTLNGLAHPVVFPVHPRTAARMEAGHLVAEDYPNIRFISPVGYGECISWQAGAECIITDSGGIQKEAYMLRKKCITLRSETEWNDTLTHGWNTLVFEDIEAITQLVHGEPGRHDAHMFGNGRAAEAIAGAIMRHFERTWTLRTSLPDNISKLAG